MLPITGYADRWSVRPGETIRFMVGVRGGGRYRARIARVLCGDPNPAGPGYREVAADWDGAGEFEGAERAIHLGSWVDVPGVGLPGGPVVFAATVWPTRLGAGAQGVLDWSGDGVGLTLGVGAEGAFARVGGAVASVGRALTERAWHDIACFYDPASGRLEVAQAPRRARLDREERGLVGADGPVLALAGAGRVAIARGDGVAHFNGKIERPRILGGGAGLAAVLAGQASGAAAACIAEWDFGRGIDTQVAEDIGPGGHHGRLVNLPTRGMTGSRWTGALHRWTEAPAQWACIHFHDDDLGDAGWPESIAVVVPEGWRSGVYALHLEAGGARDNIVFYVRALEAGSQARVAFLAPTFSYTVYGQFQREGKQAEIAARAAAWGALPHAPDGNPAYGVSPYNLHSDGSGVVMSTMRRPMIDKRVNQFILMDPDPGGSGTYWMTADSYLTDMLDRAGIPFEVITDHDLHAEGVGLLSRYDCVITGQHPEYHTTETLDGLAAYLGSGGRFIYLGGNGFYWKVVPLADGPGQAPWAFELRRAEGGVRLWETLPGEGYHAFDGSYGGLWRRLGRAPQSLVGVGFSTQGQYLGFPYVFDAAILDPRVAFMRAGIEDAAAPGVVFGERGLMGGGAAGHELDRADVRLGTPHHALVVGHAVVEHASYQPVNEERFDHTWPAAREAIIRSDLTFFETAGGGAVFSVGSMNFIGALPVDLYGTVLARMVLNVIRRFADRAAFLPPG